jgi:PilZ domain
VHLLLFTADPLLVSAFTDISKKIGVEAKSVGDSDRFSHHLSNAKYEGIVLDFDTVSAVISLGEAPNAGAVVFAVATGARNRDRALQNRVHFLLQRPIDKMEIKRTLNSAYDLMYMSRRRYFRCAAELPVELTSMTSRTTFQCRSMDVSSNGIAVKTPVPLNLAEMHDIALFLPNGFTVCATGIVIWDDKHGKCGLKMHCSGPEMRKQLDAWLDSQFGRMT